MKTNYTIDNMGNKYHYDSEGNLHSINDEPAVILNSGEKKWYYNGLIHREGTPAVNIPGYENQYFHMGKLHRENGPAIESIDDEQFWINGYQISKEKFEFHKKIELKLINKENKSPKRKI